MSRLVLGINSAHGDAAAALAGERGLIAAIAGERINRKKRCGGFPALAAPEVLRSAGARPEDPGARSGRIGARFHQIEHRLAHLASSYSCSPFELRAAAVHDHVTHGGQTYRERALSLFTALGTDA